MSFIPGLPEASFDVTLPPTDIAVPLLIILLPTDIPILSLTIEPITSIPVSLAIMTCLYSSPSLGSVPTYIPVPLLIILSVIFIPMSLLSSEEVVIEPTCIPVPPLTIIIVFPDSKLESPSVPASKLESSYDSS